MLFVKVDEYQSFGINALPTFELSSNRKAMEDQFHTESLMMSHGYHPQTAEGSVKPPLYQTSTYEFKTAEEGKAHFELATGAREAKPGDQMGHIYARLSNPTTHLLEQRIALLDKCDQSAAFASGMAAISTLFLAFLKPGDLLVHSIPVYGGTDHFIHHYLLSIGVNTLAFVPGEEEQLETKILASPHVSKLRMIYTETPANPSNDVVDLDILSSLAKKFSTEEKKVLLAVDNTYMGPLWQHPVDHGADFVVYSATKYIGGHSDLIAGMVSGFNEHMPQLKKLRVYLGGVVAPFNSWLMLRSLETLSVRMERQAKNAVLVADYLKAHPKVAYLRYLGNLPEGSREQAIYKKQYKTAGAMMSFDIKGGEAEAFRFLNALKLFKLAVSLGSTESLAEHPYTMTHSNVDEEHKKIASVSDALIRLSIGVEHPDDLISDLENALKAV